MGIKKIPILDRVFWLSYGMFIGFAWFFLWNYLIALLIKLIAYYFVEASSFTMPNHMILFFAAVGSTYLPIMWQEKWLGLYLKK